MKAKFLRILSIFACFVILIANLNVDNVFAAWKIENDTFTIYNEEAGKLYSNNLVHGISSDCKHIIVSGNINDSDLGSLACFVSDYNSIDIYNTNILEIKTSMFCNKYNLKKFVCPKNLKSIGRSCFFNCPSLEQVVMPDSLETINDGSFQFCPKLHLTLPSSLKIGRMVFHKCPYVDSSRCGKLSIVEKTNCESNKVEHTYFIANIWTSLTKTLFN